MKSPETTLYAEWIVGEKNFAFFLLVDKLSEKNITYTINRLKVSLRKRRELYLMLETLNKTHGPTSDFLKIRSPNLTYSYYSVNQVKGL